MLLGYTSTCVCALEDIQLFGNDCPSILLLNKALVPNNNIVKQNVYGVQQYDNAINELEFQNIDVGSYSYDDVALITVLNGIFQTILQVHAPTKRYIKLTNGCCRT